MTVSNYIGKKLKLDITEIISNSPTVVSEGAVVDIEDEWFIKWSPDIQPNESKKLCYSVEEGTEFDIDIKGIEKDKLVLEI